MAKRTNRPNAPKTTDPSTASERPRRRRTAAPVPTAVLEPSHHEVAERAYHLYIARGGEPGRDFDDWLQAERELRAERSQT